MGYYVNPEQMEDMIQALGTDYRIMAPKRLFNRGWEPGTDIVRYEEVHTAAEIEFNSKSDFSPKEAFYPITQPLLYFTEEQCLESELEDARDIIVFARACDVNGMKRLDRIFLDNGGKADNYYKRLREKVHIFLMECKSGGWDTCFCVPMHTNETKDYSAAIRKEENGYMVSVEDPGFLPLFSRSEEAPYQPEFVQQNILEVELPQIPDKETRDQVFRMDFWADFNEQCLSCGACNTVCITCSCFDTLDILYGENSREGERRRNWSSCMLEEYSTMAGGHNVRKTAGERMRFKVMHKFYDYALRFPEDTGMCVGCGRCIRRCPKHISIVDIVAELNKGLSEKGKEEMRAE